MGFSIKFGNTKYAQSMRYGMADVIDVTGYREAFPAKASGKSYRESFDELMGFYGMSPIETKCADMRTRTFVINDTALTYYSVAQARNYARLEIDNHIYYIFITGAVQQNSNATLYSFEVDWWHTWICYRGKLPKLYEGYVVRDNKHKIIRHAKYGGGYYGEIEVGQGAETPQLFDLKEVESVVTYHTKGVDLLENDEVYFVKAIMSEPSFTINIDNQSVTISGLKSGYNGLYTVFLPLFRSGDDTQIVAYYEEGGLLIGGQVLGFDSAFKVVRAIATAPPCVSIEVLPEVPAFKSVARVTEDIDGTPIKSIKVVFSASAIRGEWHKTSDGTPPLVQVTTDVFMGQPSIATADFKPVYRFTSDPYDFFNAPKYSNIFDTEIIAQGQTSITKAIDYDHKNLRKEIPFEPKLAQPQYCDIVFTDNQGATFTLDMTQKGALEKTLKVVCDYNGTNNKRKFYIDGVGGDNGKKYCAIEQTVSAMPLVNDALIDYLNANKNQMTTGLALAKRNMIVSNVTTGLGAIGSAIGLTAATGNTVAAGGAIIGGLFQMGKNALQYDNTLQQHEAQIADLKEQANSVELKSGNNAEFDIADGNGIIKRYKWTTSQRDRERLVEYFHKNGYAVGEWQTNISLDTMYYFDYIQAQDINFYVSGSVRDDEMTQSSQPASMPYECEAYIRNLFARGVRIWHGRRDGDGYNAPALFKTPYLNTAKEY